MSSGAGPWKGHTSCLSPRHPLPHAVAPVPARSSPVLCLALTSASCQVRCFRENQGFRGVLGKMITMRDYDCWGGLGGTPCLPGSNGPMMPVTCTVQALPVLGASGVRLRPFSVLSPPSFQFQLSLCDFSLLHLVPSVTSAPAPSPFPIGLQVLSPPLLLSCCSQEHT